MPKQPKPSQLELEVPVFRNADEWSGGAEHLADMLAVRDTLVDDLRTEVRKRKKEIKARDAEISNVAKALREGRQHRDQKPLFKRDAEQALAAVHKRVEGGNGTGAPLPTDAHVFIPIRNDLDECFSCGSHQADPVHVAAQPGTIGAAVQEALDDVKTIEQEIEAGKGNARAVRRGRARRGEARA